MVQDIIKLGYISSNVLDVQINLLSALSNKGIECKLLSFSMRKGETEYKKIEGELFYESNSRFRGPLFYKSRLKKIFNFYLANHFLDDISIFHANMMSAEGYLCRLIKNKLKTHYVVSVRNTDINLKFLWFLPWLKRMCYKNLLEAEKIVFLSESYMKTLLSRFKPKDVERIADKCVVVPNGVDNFWLKNIYHKDRVLEKKPITLITIGRLEHNKNQLGVAQAIEMLQKNTKMAFSYFIIGESKDDLLVNELKKMKFIEIKGFMKKEFLIDELRTADIYIMASHTETFGLVYVEAMSQGLPVIYTKGQGFDGQFDDGFVGFSCDSNNVKSICDAIEKTINHYEHPKHLSLYIPI